MISYCNHDLCYRFLKSAVYGINTSRQTTTKYTPFFLMFLREAKAPHIINTLYEKSDGVLGTFEGKEAEVIGAAVESCMKITKTVSIVFTNHQIQVTLVLRGGYIPENPIVKRIIVK